MFVYVFVRKTLVSIPTTTVTITTTTIIANGECMCIAFAHETLVTIATTTKCMCTSSAQRIPQSNSATAVAPREYSAAPHRPRGAASRGYERKRKKPDERLKIVCPVKIWIKSGLSPEIVA